MDKKPACYQAFYLIVLTFLAACGRHTALAPIEPTLPPIVSSPPLPTSTFIPVTVTPSPMPATPAFPLITPDVAQMERWNEYENALAQAFFKSYLQPDEVVCEWEILGRADQEVYVWGYCSVIYSATPSAASIPAVIHLRTDGSVQNAEIPGSGTSYGIDIRRMFPPELQERIFGHFMDFQQLDDRLRWRRGHPDEPPWIVLNSLSTQPTPAFLPWITPDPIQVERWKEYQTALAEQLSYLPSEQVLCEWELLGRDGNEIYVWAVCGEIRDVRVGLESPARIDVREDGSVQYAIAPGIGVMGLSADIRQIFPLDVQQRYYEGQIHFQELVDHLRWRQKLGREEPPLIILRAIPSP